MHSYLEGEEEVNVLTDNQKFPIPYYYYIELQVLEHFLCLRSPLRCTS